jgi:hypothetical protein
VGPEKKVVGPEKKVVGPEKMPWVPNKIFPYIYLSPFGFGMRVFFLLRLSQIYIVLERVKAGFFISADRFINIITKCG